ncbi:hypothetical protein CCAX7_23360 [Capsulimonas corticalis]|uniref:Uncharacterized protein n=1 Tax=Capsulimonas corticalis TaxID=2219043 RepID=A0A402CV54_9BACT|nr:WD40 repeat domain-containing protein [Capsulimonas corticalis]BDI30285.1 hypothetical protein CCAX7_23360 [Capsulimonas corticalis]
MPSLVISSIDDPPPPRAKRWPWFVATALVGIPLAITLAGRFTAPPVVLALPVGRLIYMDADAPSEKTTTLRGMRLVTPDGASRELLREVEPQDTDGGSRDWINQPTFSPDGKQIAYVKQVITILEGTHDIVHQLWVSPSNTNMPGGGKPRLLLDLSKNQMQPPSGLAWTPDGKSIVFLNDGTIYTVPVAGGSPAAAPLYLPPIPASKDGAPATSAPATGPMGLRAFLARTKSSADLNVFESESHRTDPSQSQYETGVDTVAYSTISNVAAYALNPARDKVAYVTKAPTLNILVSDSPQRHAARVFHIDPGWSVFGGRTITSLRWSPDGKYLAYTVSKPPVPEDELFCLDLATGKSVKLPMRVGRAGWDWGV